MSSAETILATERLTKKFGGLVAVDNVNFFLQRGEIRAVIGPNGAGKTTLFNLIAGTIQPTSGKIFFKRKDITALSVCERVKFGLGRSFQEVNICRGLTVRQNVEIATQNALKKSPSPFEIVDMRQARERASHLLREFNLENDAEIEAECLIHGNQKRLETMLALALEPEILLLDEPASGADEEGVAAIMELIKAVSTDRTILLTDHDIKFVMGVADRITVLDQGKIIAEGSLTEIAQNKMVQEAYLGVATQ